MTRLNFSCTQFQLLNSALIICLTKKKRLCWPLTFWSYWKRLSHFSTEPIRQSKIALKQTPTLKLGVTLVLTVTHIYVFIILNQRLPRHLKVPLTIVIWVSVSEPHTSDLNSVIFLRYVYIYIYISYVREICLYMYIKILYVRPHYMHTCAT